jgi:hypothetical protein
MPLMPNPTGSAVAAYIQANKPTAGTPVTIAQLTALWQGIVAILDTDIATNALVAGTVTSGLGAGGTVEGTVS